MANHGAREPPRCDAYPRRGDIYHSSRGAHDEGEGRPRRARSSWAVPGRLQGSTAALQADTAVSLLEMSAEDQEGIESSVEGPVLAEREQRGTDMTDEGNENGAAASPTV